MKIKVGVFVNACLDEILQKAKKYRLNYVQLHGNETPDFCRSLQDAGYAVIKAFSIASEDDLLQTSAYETFAEYFLFDTKDSQRGGTGKRFDWSVLSAYRGDVPFLLSGGIGVEHISDLLSFSHHRMAGVDINSRFERSPALKDTDKLKQFVCQFRNLKKTIE